MAQMLPQGAANLKVVYSKPAHVWISGICYPSQLPLSHMSQVWLAPMVNNSYQHNSKEYRHPHISISYQVDVWSSLDLHQPNYVYDMIYLNSRSRVPRSRYDDRLKEFDHVLSLMT